VFTAHQLLDRLGDWPQLKVQITQLLTSALKDYALGYEQELERLITSFHFEVSSEIEAPRVLRTLSGPRSPQRALIATVAHNAELGLTGDKTGYFDPMVAVEDHFGTLSALLTAGKSGDAFAAYQDILRTLASKLAAPAPAPTPTERPAAGGAAAPGAASSAITARLSPAGALAFATVTGATDTPLAALDAWLADKALTEEVVDMFRAPVRAIYQLGARDVEGALGAWDRDVQTSADADLFSRFPFDRHSGDDLDPQTLSVWLQPKRGRLAGELLPAVAGLVTQARGWDGHARHRPAHPCNSDDVCVHVPPALLATLDRLAVASELLWDDAGKPRPLEVSVTPRPFTLAAGDGPLPELVRLSVGESSVLYFNQRPRRTTLALDWTKDQTATLTVQIKQDGSLSLTPPAIAAAGSPWAFYHLLQQAERRNSTYTWRVPIAPTQVLSISYDVTDPTAAILGTSKALVSRGPR
jgi:type VI secretion system protein ImpL